MILMYDELIERLRETPSIPVDAKLHNKAADAIEELQKQLDNAEIENIKLKEEFAKYRGKNRWIPVTERLPEDGAEVLAFNKTGFAYVDLWMDGKWKIQSMVDEEHESVTHWLPLPQPPERDGE